MKDESKTKTQLIQELNDLRNHISELESSKANGRVQRQNPIQEKDYFNGDGMVATVENIADGVRTKESLRKSEQVEEELRKAKGFCERLIETANTIILTLDENANIVTFNRFAEKLTGYSKEEVLNRNWFDLFIPKRDRSEIPVVFKQVLEEMPEVSSHQNPIVCKNGKERLIEWKNTVLKNEKGGIDGVLSIGLDITDQKRTEEKMKKSLKEKDVLLKEIHHRVKNNLQVISSLINLQSRYINDPNSLVMFQETCNRVRSMALVHEELYRSKDFTKVNFAEYINGLVSRLISSYTVDLKKIKLETDVKDVSLGIDAAVPCGLIINELVSNAIKYAFPPSWKGRAKIKIILRKNGNKIYELIIKDNGIGFSKDIDIRNTKSLGLRLVTILAEDQLEGSITLGRQQGTKFQIQFKDN